MFLNKEHIPLIMDQLKEEGFKTGILSNGSKKMLESAVKNADISGLLDEVISVNDDFLQNAAIRVFKFHKIF